MTTYRAHAANRRRDGRTHEKSQPEIGKGLAGTCNCDWNCGWDWRWGLEPAHAENCEPRDPSWYLVKAFSLIVAG